MKTIKTLLLVGAVSLLASCASTAKFPVSSVTPAAHITAKMKQDKNNNYKIEVTAKHLAAAERLTPPRNNYIVWILTDKGMVNNAGQLVNKNAENASLTITTSFNVKEIFITAENQGDLSYPAGVEISRTTFNK
jgi:phosphopantothenoylcysteine synthetase/decarboxylase